MAGYLPRPGNRSSERNAFNLSRKLRSAGYLIRGSADYGRREGIFVKGPQARVIFDFDVITGSLREMSNEIAALMESWGYVVRRSSDPENVSVYTTGRVSPERKPAHGAE